MTDEGICSYVIYLGFGMWDFDFIFGIWDFG